MENNIDDLLISVCQILRNPNDYNYLKTETMCLSLEILNQRLNDSCSSVYNQDISEQEYKYYFENFFTNFTDLDLDVIIDEIKYDIKNIEGDTKNEKDNN